VHGLSYLGQVRPAQETIEFWDGRVRRKPCGPAAGLGAASPAQRGQPVPRAVALKAGEGDAPATGWPGSAAACCSTRQAARRGGFGFWQRLPAQHCGEDVLAQLRVMERYGGCAILPSGAYHMVGLALGVPSVGIFWLTNLIEGMPLRPSTLHAAMAARTRCPACDQDNLRTRCPHDPSFVADVGIDEVEALARAALNFPASYQ
jgi:hypothetical protein